MELSEVCDRVEIGAVLDAYAIGLDRVFGTSLVRTFPVRVDPVTSEAVLQLFTPDGVLHTPFGRAEGREAIRAGWDGIATLDTAGGPDYVRHHITSRAVTMVDSTTAHATVYVQGLTEHGLDHWGHYEHRMVKLADGWKFAEQFVIVHGWIPGGYYASLPNPENPVPS